MRSLIPVTRLGRVVAWKFRTGCWGFRRPLVSKTMVRSVSALPFPTWLSPWDTLAQNTPSERCTFLRCWRRAGAQRCLARLQWTTHKIKQNERKRQNCILYILQYRYYILWNIVVKYSNTFIGKQIVECGYFIKCLNIYVVLFIGMECLIFVFEWFI